jgi:putative ABC transport system permease protein
MFSGRQFRTGLQSINFQIFALGRCCRLYDFDTVVSVFALGLSGPGSLNQLIFNLSPIRHSSGCDSPYPQSNRMFRNYVKTAWRNLVKNKFYSLINIVGLSAGLAIGILILLWVQDELSFDGFHKKTADIYRLECYGGTGASKQIWDDMVAPIGPLAKQQLPEVRDEVRLSFNFFYSLYKYKDKAFGDDHVTFADPSFFTVFDFPLIKGDPAHPFPDDQSVVITQKTAKKYFGDQDPMGKVIVADNKVNFKVTGVIRDFPENSSMNYDMLMPMSFMAKKWWERDSIDIKTDFVQFNFTTFLLLKPGTSLKSLSAKLYTIHIHHKPDDTDVDYLLLPLAKMHLYRADLSDAGIGTVRVFMIVALLILAIACINYVNLSTARALLRSKEISMRKIVGAAKRQLFLQFIVETGLLFILAAILALALISASIPLFNQVSGKQLVFDLTNAHIWEVIGITILGTLAASSIYPALLLSSFEPLKALKSKVTTRVADGLFRKILVVVQFSASMILIVGTLVISRQMNYIRSKELGYDKDHVLTLWMRDMTDRYDAARAELLKEPGVLGVTRADGNIVDIGNMTGNNNWDGKGSNQTFIVHPMGIDKDFLSFFKMQLAAGEGFRGTKADSTHFILNEAAVKELGLKNPIGKRFKLWNTNGTIIGVAKDFHFASMKEKIGPAVFYSGPWHLGQMYIRTDGRDPAKIIAAAQAQFKRYNNDYPFSYTFLDDTFNRLYQSEEREGTLFVYFTAIAILISCLGLLGLAAFSANTRFREIGVRKVLGASVTGIMTLLAKDFIKLVLLAIVIAIPIAWYAMDKWLQGFAYRTQIGYSVFVLSGLIALSISLATISWQAVKAALMNPVNSLRSE